jgi:hypothetical protein
LYPFSNWFCARNYKAIKQKEKAKNGSYAIGKIIDVRKILGNEDDTHNYEGTIEFSMPPRENTYQVKYKFSSLRRPNLGMNYKIWVDEKEPGNSIVVNNFGNYWRYSIAFFIVLITGLFVVDFILLKRIIN